MAAALLISGSFLLPALTSRISPIHPFSASILELTVGAVAAKFSFQAAIALLASIA
jgi:hypothetical protein